MNEPSPSVIADLSSPVAPALQRFLAFKRAAGCRYHTEAHALRALDRFLTLHLTSADPVTSWDVIREYVARRGQEAESTRMNRLSLIRQVCRFVALEEPRTAIPGPRFLAINRDGFVPRVFTRDEGRRFLQACTGVQQIPGPR